MSELFTPFHFLRPAWFWATLPLLLIVVLLARRHLGGGNWSTVVDPALLPHMLESEAGRNRLGPLLLLAGGLLAITALAGPAWQKVEQPLFRQQSALVILLDLSRSMNASDIKPSRLERAKMKIVDILERRREGLSALIAFAATPYVVTPLTDDTETISSQLAGMASELMPAQGSRVDRAIDLGRQLLRQGGMVNGSLLLVGDGIEGTPQDALEQSLAALLADGYQLQILGVGTAAGAPIPQPGGGFIKNRRGEIVVPGLDSNALRSTALHSGGNYHALTADNRDIDALLAPLGGIVNTTQQQEQEGVGSDQWRDEGPWLLLPLMLLALLAFRRGSLWLLLIFLLPLPEPGHALEWSELWLNRNQQAQRAFEAGDSSRAAQLFTDPNWRASSYYRTGDYPQALEALAGIEGAEAAYNRGNAMAQLGRYNEALKEYRRALELAPQMPDARHNHDLLQQWLENQQQEGEDGDAPPQDKKQGGTAQQGEQPSSAQQQTGEQQAGTEQQGKQGREMNAANEQDAAEAQQDDREDGQREAQQVLRRQLQQQGAQQTQAEKSPTEPSQSPAEQGRPSEQQQATEQWLRRIPDDPAGLWRRKFLYQYKQQQQSQREEEQPW